jgi:hypothetical protein
MNGRQFARYLARDLRCPCGCIDREDTYVPNHRAGRGMGGSKLLDRPSNIIVMCSRMNDLIETNAGVAAQSRENGWKLNRWQSPEDTPFLDLGTMTWHLIDNTYNRVLTQKAAA